jgi:ABC-type polysaccharide/polyol phosphate transport system ATPase subunit
MIRLRNVRKVYPTRFGEKLVLDNVSFDLAMGEHLGVLGRNGAGKSTMVRLISGAERPSSGRIDREMSVSWPLAFGGAFHPMITGIDNVRFISRVYKQDFESNLEFVEQFAELGPYLREPVRSYSSGMRARLAFAISMITEFDCFLIDEIGAVGDARFHERCNYELFDKRANRAMVIISHDASYVRDHCNRFGVLHDAKLEIYDDFEIAYTEFKQLIGVSQTPVYKSEKKRDEPWTFNRSRLLSDVQRAALADDRFFALVQEAGSHSNRQNWAKAETLFAQALSLFPYERAYWTQHGHMTKVQGDFLKAEISYRTAYALDYLDREDILTHLQFVVEMQGIIFDEVSVPIGRIANFCGEPSGKPDIDTLAILFGVENFADDEAIVDLLRRYPTLDTLVAYFFRQYQNAPTIAGSLDRLEALPNEDWLKQIGCIAFAKDYDISTLDQFCELKSVGSVLPFLIENNAFSGWPETQAVISEFYTEAKLLPTA